MKRGTRKKVRPKGGETDNPGKPLPSVPRKKFKTRGRKPERTRKQMKEGRKNTKVGKKPEGPSLHVTCNPITEGYQEKVSGVR